MLLLTIQSIITGVSKSSIININIEHSRGIGCHSIGASTDMQLRFIIDVSVECDSTLKLTLVTSLMSKDRDHLLLQNEPSEEDIGDELH